MAALTKVLVAASLVGLAGAAPVVTVSSRSALIYSNVTQKLRLQGTGFKGDGDNIHLKFVPTMSPEDYKITVVSDTVLSLGLKPGKSWPRSAGLDMTSLYLTEFRDDKQGAANLLEDSESVLVATVIETPSVMHGGDKVIYMTGTPVFNINGTGFREKSVQLTFDPPLERDVDYVLQVKSKTFMQLTRKTGKKWRSDGEPGPLKLRRIDTGAGPLRIDAKYGGVTVAEVQVDLGAHGVTVETTQTQYAYQSQASLSIQGDGFNTTAAYNTLKWGNSLRGKGLNYTIVGAQDTRLDLKLTPGSTWRANPTNLPGPLVLLAVNAGAGLVPVGPTEAKKGRTVATIFEDPYVAGNPTRTVYQTHTHELFVTGRGFTTGKYATTLSFEPALQFGVDYVLQVFNRTHILVALLDGRKWAPTPGPLRVTAIDTGAGPFRDFTPVVIANVAADADESKTGISVTRTTAQTLYQTAAYKKLTVSGTALCAAPENIEFQPPLTMGVDYEISAAKPDELELTLKPGKKWRYEAGALYVTAMTCPGQERVAFAYEQGIAVATILADPTVEPSERRIYQTYTKQLIVSGSGFSMGSTELALRPTSRTAYDIDHVEANDVVLTLKDGKSWIPDASQADADPETPLGEIAVTQIDTGAGHVNLAGDGVVVARVYPDSGDGRVCDDSCEWALDGVCDDGSAAGMRAWQDDDYGGFYAYDDDYYGGLGYYYEDDDDFLAPVCEPGTDCTDCGAAAHGPDEVASLAVECTNTCTWARDDYCDDTRTSGLCDLGTDCQDCGPASAGNYTKYDDDGWWDDDASYWDDDYDFGDYDSVDDAPHVAFIQSTPNPKTRAKDMKEQQGIGGIFMMILEGIVVGIGAIMCTIGSWFAFRFYKGEKLPFDLVPPEDADFEAGKPKKAAADITPDVTYSGK
eukprot:CAMPEP_0185693838 /NCGR_PEP_ID=MMETSP1164-20130828/3499_1 /TAXON_ID=1104430 /ORGANISM="Chrysoreinhardia sp, Strain CCMP2950" /LENGTH=914 /DNA_ID=CAMNT_0028360647 /DNA_START=66 /DNA_END=2810 /DNA_ORIENTATION=+